MSTAFVYKPRPQHHVIARHEEYRQMDIAAGNIPLPRLLEQSQNRIRESAPPSLNASQQENVMTLLAFDEQSCVQLRNKVDLSLFDSEQYRTIVSKCIQYIDEFGKPPANHLPDLFDEILNGDNWKKAALYRNI